MLSCECGWDGDIEDGTYTYENIGMTTPPDGAKCCECCAPLPPEEKATTIRLTRYRDEHGAGLVWDCNSEFYIEEEIHQRCEDCSDLADSVESLGFCEIAPEELLDTHLDYVRDYQDAGQYVGWFKNSSGVFKYRKWTRYEKIRWNIKRLPNRLFWKFDRWKYVAGKPFRKVLRMLGYQYRYNRELKTYRWTRDSQ